MPTLILSPRQTEDAQRLWRAASLLGWRVERLQTLRVPDELTTASEPVLYIEALLAPLVAPCFGLRLIEPPEDWLPKLPDEYRKRTVRLAQLDEARALQGPAFVKPPNEKSFPARVYLGADLPAEYPHDMPVLIQDVVSWEKEFRCFILDRSVKAFSVYLRHGELQREAEFASSDAEDNEMLAFLCQILADPRVYLPRAIVMDVGTIQGRGWAVIELNAAWGSGIYGCDPVSVLEVLRWAGEGGRSP
jgi:hypothetical protein